jgi:non-homologous end joining protein Ku
MTNQRALAIVLAFALVITFVSSASAASCQNVDIKLDNQTSVRIKALYANFKCEGENEKKEMFKNVEVPEQTKLPVATQQNLQSCKGKKMNYIEVHYRVRCGDGSWSNEKFVKDSSFLNPYCASDAGKEYTVVLPADNPQATCN